MKFRELNEKRSIGILSVDKHDDNSETVLRIDDGRIIANFECDRHHLSDEDIQANAEYAALAINNFDSVAEALIRCRDWFYLNAKPLKGVGSPSCINEVVKVLDRIM